MSRWPARSSRAPPGTTRTPRLQRTPRPRRPRRRGHRRAAPSPTCASTCGPPQRRSSRPASAPRAATSPPSSTRSGRPAARFSPPRAGTSSPPVPTPHRLVDAAATAAVEGLRALASTDPRRWATVGLRATRQRSRPCDREPRCIERGARSLGSAQTPVTAQRRRSSHRGPSTAHPEQRAAALAEGCGRTPGASSGQEPPQVLQRHRSPRSSRTARSTPSSAR